MAGYKQLDLRKVFDLHSHNFQAHERFASLAGDICVKYYYHSALNILAMF